MMSSTVSSQIDTEAISVESFDLPVSKFLEEKTPQRRYQNSLEFKAWIEKITQTLPALETAKISEVSKIRQNQAELFYTSAAYDSLMNIYKVSVKSKMIDGVNVEVFTPNEGASAANKEYVLINLHGGGFKSGSRTISHLESIPIAAEGEIKVISVDYRMAPEHQFPAASDDAVVVYKKLLEVYKASNIGVYGCSAGALLTTQLIARLQQEKLPLPSAVGLLCGAAYYWNEGDSGHISDAIQNFPLGGRETNSYFRSIDAENSLAFPGRSSAIMSKFPPTILMSATRDFALSTVVVTHAQLVKLGVEASLHVWEGLGHVFLYESNLSESQDVYGLLINFFKKHLGKNE